MIRAVYRLPGEMEEKMQERISVENWRIEDLRPDPGNPRKNDAAVPGVRESIKAFGFRTPIVIDQYGNIVAGHTRYKAALELGMEELPCIVADQLSDKQLRAFQLADNKTGEFAKWDTGLLISELDDLLGSFEMSIYGFNLKSANDKKTKEKDEQFVTCPRCGNKIPRKQAIAYHTDDFEGE